MPNVEILGVLERLPPFRYEAHAVALGARTPHGRSLRAVQHAKLYRRGIRDTPHLSAERIDFPHNLPLRNTADNRLQNIVETPDDNDMSKIRDEYVVFDNAENTIVRGQVMSDVKKMVNLLPPTQREVVYMRYYQQLSFKEIAELTNVSINTSLGRMRYALLNLRRMAKEHDVFSNITMF